MRPGIDAWVGMIVGARAAGVPVIRTTPVSRADGVGGVTPPTDLSAETGVPPTAAVRRCRSAPPRVALGYRSFTTNVIHLYWVRHGDSSTT